MHSWQIKVYIGICDPKDVILILVTGSMGGGGRSNLYKIF